LVEKWNAILVDRYTDVVALRLSFARLAGGQIDLDPLHVNLAQAHHHEAGEQKEHDIDQRNDLDSRFLVRNGSSDLHRFAFAIAPAFMFRGYTAVPARLARRS